MCLTTCFYQLEVIRTLVAGKREIKEKLISRDDDQFQLTYALVSMEPNPGLNSAETTVTMKVSVVLPFYNISFSKKLLISYIVIIFFEGLIISIFSFYKYCMN